MCALISRIRESDPRRDAAYKYRRAVMGGQSRLLQDQDQDQDQDTASRPSPPLWIYPSGPNLSTLQPWEDTFLSSGWPRAASRPGPAPAPAPPPDPPPVGRTPRVCRAFTANQRLLRVYQNRKRAGARTWTDTSARTHTATTKVRSEESEHLYGSVSAASWILMSQKIWIKE